MVYHHTKPSLPLRFDRYSLIGITDDCFFGVIPVRHSPRGEWSGSRELWPIFTKNQRVDFLNTLILSLLFTLS